MKTLVIETSTEKALLALLHGKKILDLLFLSGGPLLSKTLGADIASLLKKNSCIPDQIYVGEGPGSLTGVRVGLAMAKSLAFGWQIPCIPFCSLSVFIPETDGSFAVLVDAKMGGIHLLQGKALSHKAPVLVPPEEALEMTKDTPILTSPHPTLIEKRGAFLCKEADPSLGFIQNTFLKDG